jgi:hypothetical protein
MALCGLVAFIASFQPWYQVSISNITLFSDNAWNAGLISWLPVLLLVVVGVGALLPAFGQRAPSPIVTAGVGLVCAGLLIIRLATFPSYSSGDNPGIDNLGVSQGAGAGIYIALLIALIVTVVGLLSGGAAVVARWYAKIKQQRRSGPPPPTGS